ncbi:bifunctional non-homologous end joining protein LigD [Bhargavaea ginsengi]|uniref:Bifunctional non-homologous end joining protein LigD n=1 Tax=Bhargavaea ginsengi TaxID=426757 RepID=A0A1H6ZC20_9BACL|nr:DNA ligase D [Bhargavaea ginsengi]SEJ50999.1 bifunctional non-homologous end joining protein LigD [Bhargavaea ginsengi]
MKPMKLTPAETLPEGSGWLYEVKYDGFRCLLDWRKEGIRLLSRNGNDLADRFPEIIAAITEASDAARPYLPLLLDGELVFLINDVRSDFPVVARRSRLRTQSAIEEQSRMFPCRFAAFDLLEKGGEDLRAMTVEKRKQALGELLRALDFPLDIHYLAPSSVQGVAAHANPETLMNRLIAGNGEGLVAKRSGSRWQEGIRSTDWVKIKNWRTVPVVLTAFEAENSNFSGRILDEGNWREVVTLRHGFSEEESKTLIALFKANGTEGPTGIYTLAPAVVAEVLTIGESGGKLREPRFSQFLLDEDPETVTVQRYRRALEPIPPGVTVTNPDKPLFPEAGIDKDSYLLYLQNVAPHLLPWLENRPLTVIRYPHGTDDAERFYQKHAPDSLPSFVQTAAGEEGELLLCDSLETLLWLGNQAALELHVPFGRLREGEETLYPDEIVFDLDPPDATKFRLAVDAALRLKKVFDGFGLTSFVKTSGGKGMQLYLPIPPETFSYEDTRQFTSFAADYLCEQAPEHFTTERMKKKRGGRLYVDYVQHARGKTIIAPYSTRGSGHAPVATPLEWHELTEDLRPEMFTIRTVTERLRSKGDPFRLMEKARENQPFGEVLEKLKEMLK